MHHHNPEKTSDLLAAVRGLLDQGKPKEAVEAIRHYHGGGTEVSNAYGVCLMRAGEIAKALEVYRGLCLNESGVCLRVGLPTVCKTNYATALLLANNLPGCLAVLEDANDERDPGVQKLRAAIARWRQSLSWTKRLWFAMSGDAAKPAAALDFPPGDLYGNSVVRPAA